MGAVGGCSVVGAVVGAVVGCGSVAGGVVGCGGTSGGGGRAGPGNGVLALSSTMDAMAHGNGPAGTEPVAGVLTAACPVCPGNTEGTETVACPNDPDGPNWTISE